jgi:CRISPR/Cas system CMR subunit Cmr4 (Cas7 group RAMP superfamily)
VCRRGGCRRAFFCHIVEQPEEEENKRKEEEERKEEKKSKKNKRKYSIHMLLIFLFPSAKSTYQQIVFTSYLFVFFSLFWLYSK